MTISPEDPLRLRAKTYEAIRNLLISGQCEKGLQLTEAKLAVQLGVSRTPVREALMRLSDEGLIETRVNGTRVVADLRSKMIEVLHIRTRLEPFGVGLAAHRVTGEDLEALWEIQRRIEALDEDWASNCEELLELNRSFHRQIIAHCGNASLIEVLDRLSPFSVLPRTLTLYSDEERRTSFSEHRSLLDHLWKRDMEGAELQARLHLIRGIKAFENAFG